MESLNVELQPTFSDCGNILQLISTYQNIGNKNKHTNMYRKRKRPRKYIYVYLIFKKKKFYYHKFLEVEGAIDKMN